MNAPPILVVDDDADLRRLVRTLLERSGHRVVEAADGTSALQEFRDIGPALVVAGLNEVAEVKSRFVASVAHELRGPLTSIRGFSEALLDPDTGRLNGDQHTSAQLVHRNAERMQRIVDDLLDLSRLEAGSVPPHSRAGGAGKRSATCSRTRSSSPSTAARSA